MICSIEGCERRVKAKGLCNMHYVRLQKYGSTDDRPRRSKNTNPCSVAGCNRIVHAKGYCLKHYKRHLKYNSPDASNLQKASPGALKGKICRVEGCSNKAISTKTMLCNKHSLRMKQHGTTSDSVLKNRRSLSLQDRIEFGSKVDKETSCWIWQRGLFSNGYGQISIAGKPTPAHRASYIAFIGPIPEGKLVCHACDNPLCVNPDHLWIGTNRDNMEDMVKKGRSAVANNAHAKLTIDQVKAIKRQYGKKNMEELADIFFVTPPTIARIVYGESWKHVLPELTLASHRKL